MAAALWRAALRESAFWPLCALALLTLCLVAPFGDFPLNDDWAYAKNVRELVENGRYASSYMVLAIAQTLWGSAFAAIFGLDYSVLRLSTLLLALASIWLCARCAIELGAGRGMALLAACVLWANPLFLNLSYTFMSEVHFLAPISLAMLYYLRGLDSGRSWDIALGSSLAIVATSTRQFGVVVPLAYAAVVLPLWLRGDRSLHAGRLAAFSLPWLLALLAFVAMPGLEGRPPPTSDLSKIALSDALLTTWQETSKKLVSLGFFALPLSAVRFVAALRGRAGWTTRQLAAVPWLCLLILPGIVELQGSPVVQFKPLPLLGNVLYDIGSGPLTLRDTYLMHLPGPVRIGAWWWIPTLLSLVSAAVLCADLVPPLFRRIAAWVRARAGRDDGGETPPDSRFAQWAFVLLCGAMFLCAPYHLLMGPGTFDRYLLPAVPPFLILLAAGRGARRGVPLAGWILCGLLFAYSLACVQDYMAWNRARWEAIAILEDERGVESSRIDGGYEYNGVATRDEFMRVTGAGPHDWGTKGFWILDDAYCVSFNPRAGYGEIGRVAYFSWLGMATRHLLLLERAE
jgi:hypothetical protein